MTKRPVLFAFELNEFRYRRVRFSRHYSRIEAERAARRIAKTFRNYECDTASFVIEGKEELAKWATENNYKVSWQDRILIYQGE